MGTARAVTARLSPEELKSYLRGPIAFPVTPFSDDGSVDLEGARENSRWLGRTGVSALVAPSGTGELYGLSPQECGDVIQATVDGVEGRKPVIAGVGFGSSAGADLARHAERTDASGVLILPPYYANPDPAGLKSYYCEIAHATSLGVILYARAPVAFTPELLNDLINELGNLVAFKDGSGDIRLFQRIREYCRDHQPRGRLVWLAGTGDDLVGPYFAAGAEGFTSSIACFWPEVSVDLFEAAATKDWNRLEELHLRAVKPFYDLRARGAGFEVSVTKAAMNLLGYRAGKPRPPLGHLSENDMRDLESLLWQLPVPTAADRRAMTGNGESPHEP